MIEDMLDAKHGASLEAFRRFVADPEAMRGIRRIIFSGGEATLENELFDSLLSKTNRRTTGTARISLRNRRNHGATAAARCRGRDRSPIRA